MNTALNTCRIFVLLLFTSVMSTAIADKPDFSHCDGLKGAAKGLCHAGIAVGCDQEASNACEQIEEQYTAKTGNEPPWADRTIYINSESGETPLDGMWEFGCEYYEDEGGDYNEYMVFMGDTFQAWALHYTSTNGKCDAGEEITIFETGTVTVPALDDLIVSWYDGNIPMRLVGDGGTLNPTPVVTPLIISITTGDELGDYKLFYYMDDTGDDAVPEAKPWCIYAPWEEDDDEENGNEELDDGYSNFLTAEEPRCKI
jgi:hypothetical protein